MDFYEVIKKRRSIRGYQADPVPEAALKRIMEAVWWAPSACGRQPYRFLVVTNPEMHERIYKCYPNVWLKEAPMIVVACGNAEESWHRLDGQPAVDLDLGIAMEHLVLAAAAESLGTCWVCAYDVDAMTKAVNLEAPWRALAITPVGFARSEPKSPLRKDMDALFKVVK